MEDSIFRENTKEELHYRYFPRNIAKFYRATVVSIHYINVKVYDVFICLTIPTLINIKGAGSGYDELFKFCKMAAFLSWHGILPRLCYLFFSFTHNQARKRKTICEIYKVDNRKLVIVDFE